MRVLIVAALCAFVPLPSSDKPEADELQGAWKFVSFEGGFDSIIEKPKSQLTFLPGGKLVNQSEEDKTESTYTIDSTKTPKTLDITVTSEGPLKDITLKSIYSIEGDALKICGRVGSKPSRPTEFKVAKGTDVLLFTYKREKK